MSLRVVVWPSAETDLLESALFIAEDDPAAAQRFLDEAEKGLARLAESLRSAVREQPRSCPSRA